MRLTIEQLTAFKNRKKFSPDAWIERGLHPSNGEISAHLELSFNDCTDGLLQALDAKAPLAQIESILQKNLSSLNRAHYDGDEKQFICGMFSELSSILHIDMKESLENWLHGEAMTLLKLHEKIQSEKGLQGRKQSCTKCNLELETQIIKRKKGLPETGWLVVACNNCNELNLVSLGPGVREAKFINYRWIETLRTADYTHEQALQKLEELKKSRS